MTFPGYLANPDTGTTTYGELRHDGDRDEFEIVGKPMVMELAKRIFPGCAVVRGRQDGRVRFKATRRATGDLNWLMLRYPLRVCCSEVFARARATAIAHAERRETNHELAQVHPPRTFLGNLYPYQAEGVDFLLKNERAVLADAMGLGKTVTAIGALCAGNAFPAVVVTPTMQVARQWRRMSETFLEKPCDGALLPEPAHVITGLKPYALPAAPMYVLHYGLLRGWASTLGELNARALIFDEIQELRHSTTQKYSCASTLAGSVDLVWGLSGTPIYNYGAEIWSVLNIIDFHCLGSRDAFTREWCTGYGGDIVEKPEVLHDYLRSEGLLLRRRKDDVMHDLPEKRRVVIELEHDDDVYGRMIAQAVDMANAYQDTKDWTQRGRLARKIGQDTRRATGVAKVDHAVAFIRTLLAAGERPLIFAWHHDVHDALYDSLSRDYKVGRVTGRQSGKKKDLSISDFSAGRIDAVVLSLRTAAGLDGLQKSGTCVVFVELDWSPAVHAQCEDRLHRHGLEHDSVLCYYLVTSTGYDEIMRDVLGLKVEQFAGLMGDPTESEDDVGSNPEGSRAQLQKMIERLRVEGR